MAAFLAAAFVGLYGTVTRSPTMPVCRAGESCSAPAAGVTLAFSRNGKNVKSVVTTSKGTYRVVLTPGVYVVRLVGTSPFPRMTPVHVTVRSGAASRRTFSIDTGIR
jgi:hypothetical protein